VERFICRKAYERSNGVKTFGQHLLPPILGKTTAVQQQPNSPPNGLFEPFALAVPSGVVGGGSAKRNAASGKVSPRLLTNKKVSRDRCGRSWGNQKRKIEMTDKQLQFSTSYFCKEKQKENASTHLQQPEERGTLPSPDLQIRDLDGPTVVTLLSESEQAA